MKKQIIIFGGGHSASRYVESLIWREDFSISLCSYDIAGKTRKLAQVFQLPLYSFRELCWGDLKNFSCVILSVPPSQKKDVVEKLLQIEYNTYSVIMEKPLCINWSDYYYYAAVLPKFNRLAVVSQRDYLLSNYLIKPSVRYSVFYPTFTDDINFNCIHMLPHILSLFYSNGLPITSFSELDGNNWRGKSNDIDVEISFVSSANNRMLQINETLYPPVQYRELNARIVDHVMQQSGMETKDSVQKALSVSKMIIQSLPNKTI